MVGKPMRKWWWWLMNKQPSLSSETPQETRITTQATTNAMGNKMGQVAEVGGGYAEYGGRPRQTCQILENLMESNCVGGIFVGWGMSIASK